MNKIHAKDIRFGMRGHDLGSDFDEMIENAKKYNVHTLQFALAKTVNDVDFDSVGYDKALSDKISAALRENDLSVAVLGCYINPVDRSETELEKSLRRFENFISYASDFNAGVIGTEPGFYESLEKTHSEENYSFFIKNMRRLVNAAEEKGVVIGLEPVYLNTICSPEVTRRMLDDINSDSLAVIFDLSNILNAENYTRQHEIIDSAFALFGDKIRVIHLKDFTFENGEKRFAVTGTGMYDIEYLFSKIAALPHMPQIILDELPPRYHDEAIANLERILG